MDLSIEYLGQKLPHPFICGASPFVDTLDRVRQVEDGGAAAVVMRSLFEEQIELEALSTLSAVERHQYASSEALSYLPEPEEFVLGPGEYLEQLRKTRAAVDIPVFGSLNGFTPGGWLDYAKLIEDAGADGLELNLYFVSSSSSESAQDIEDRSVEMVREVKTGIGIPLAVKLSPFYTALPHFALRLEEAGADALVLFNRFFEPDIDTEELEVRSHLRLSDSSELLLRLRWLAILSSQLQTTTLAVTGGVHGVLDAIKATMAGANAIQLVSALLKNGPSHVRGLIGEMGRWLEEHEYHSLSQARASMNLANSPTPHAYRRANYMHILQTWEME